MGNEKQENMQRAKVELKRLIEKTKNKTIYTYTEHVSKSGMRRHIKPIVIVDGEPINISGYIADMGLFQRVKMGKGDGVIVKGCGADMGFHIVYSISRALYGDGYALKHKWF
jgi:hypothetical protein